MGASRLIGPPRHARPLALVSAVATLLGALFLCLGVGDPPGAQGPAGVGRGPAHEQALRHHTSVVEEYVCPYDHGGCSLFPALSPAVLSAPPLDPPLHAEGRLPRLGTPHHSGRAPGPGAQPRAPDLHVLQVLRT
ncbi:hypothetical protein ACIGEZ_02355 [Streptomyces sp. NPDC085481]|uniref:hypothetical protein n=1 Tax=Streptomyces sp. NPDC085481 TaxID=3365727 RepID=UPI0037D71BE5